MSLNQLQSLETENIYVIREFAAECDNPVMLFSMGKDSVVMLHLARKAFYPSAPPFPLLHIDTTWKLRAMHEFRERVARESGMHFTENPDIRRVRWPSMASPLASASKVLRCFESRRARSLLLAPG